MEADVLTRVILPISLFLIMFGMGLSLKLEDFSRVLKFPKAVTVGVVCQMIILPLIGFAIIKSFSLAPELAIGLMILTFCPGGVTSNLLTYLSRGDTALSITLTAIVSLITPFTIPLFTLLTMELLLEQSQEFSIPVLKTIIQLIVITVVPVIFGMLALYLWPTFARKSEKVFKVFSVVFLFVIIIGIVSKNWANMAGYFMQTGAATITLNGITLIVGYFVAKKFGLQKRQAISIGIEVGIQNGTLALLVSGTILGSAVMTIPAVTYSLQMFVTGALFGWLVNRHSMRVDSVQSTN